MHIQKTLLALAIGATLTAVVGCNQQAEQVEATQVEQAVHAAPIAANESINKIADLEMIGTTIEFFERVAGDPIRATEQENRYQVDGCPVTVAIAGRSVGSISIDLIPGCKMDFAGIAGGKDPIPFDGSLTFAEFQGLFGQAQFKSPCLSGCGNAYDPYVVAIAEGSRAENFRVVTASTQFVGNGAVDASFRWAEAITAKAGEDYVMGGKFNCERTFDPEARSAFANVQVESIKFGGTPDDYPCY